jgi:predicted O-methyltransferase YrrM
MKHVSIPLPNWHWLYEPSMNEMMDIVETRMIMDACNRVDRPSILEIGTFKGGTTLNMAKIAKARGGKVVTVDVQSIPDTMPKDQQGEVRGADEVGSLIPEDLKPYVVQLMVDPSTDYYGEFIEQYAPFDMMFFDGDHSLEGIRKDVENTRHMMSSECVRMLHDVWWDATPPPVDGPLRYMEEVVQGGYIMNLTHIGILTQEELFKLGGCRVTV